MSKKKDLVKLMEASVKKNQGVETPIALAFKKILEKNKKQ